MPGEIVKLLPLKGSPGIRRDGTIIEGTNWTDGLWSRFYRGLPRSMLGYRSMSENYHGPSRGMYLDARNGLLNIFSGYDDGIEVGQFTKAGVGSAPSSITPVGFTTDANNLWQLDAMFSTNGGGFTALLAHAAPNLANIDSTTSTPLYYGDITHTTPLAAAPISISGGVMYLNPFAVVYGNGGLVAVSAAGDMTSFPPERQFNICADKIIKALPIRGGAYAPSALLWSLSSLLRMSFVGGDTIFQFDTLSDSSTVLSSSAMIEHDGIYYWPGVDRWLTYNGVLNELPNNMSLDFFYKNLNFTQQQKVFAVKVPRWGEIQWHAPLFGATECNWMIVYNYRENIWYDTPLPVDGRSAGVNPSTTFPYTVIASAEGLPSLTTPNQTSYPIWQHEFGTDIVRGDQTLAVKSYITSPSMALVGGGLVLGGVNMPGDNVWTQLVRFEPDFLHNGDLALNILTREFPEGEDSTIPLTLSSDIEDVDKQARYMRYQIICNSQGNSYILGQSLIHYRTGDRNP